MVITPDLSRTDGVANRLCEMINTTLPILLISRVEEIKFNEQVLSLQGKDYVIVDFIECGWDVEMNDTLIVGKNTDQFKFLYGDGWVRLHDFVKNNPPKVYFKRELLAKDKTDKILPIEYPNWQPDYTLDTREQFNSRPIAMFNYWGRSHESRLMFHGEVWKNAARKGYAVCDNIYYFNSFMADEKNPMKFITLNIPHYSRIDISELMKINALSKLSVSLPGCGIKCFRSTGESIVNSIVVLPEDDLAYSFPLIDGLNCIKFSRNNDVSGVKNEWGIMNLINHVLGIESDNLYDIYVRSKKVADWYSVNNYIKNYLEPNINN